MEITEDGVREREGPPGSRNKTTLAREERAKTLSELARENTESALAALLEVAQDTSAPAAARVQAAKALLDRAWGRPPQHKPLYGRFEPREKDPATQLRPNQEEIYLEGLIRGD